MPLTLRYRLDTNVPVELDGATPDRLAGWPLSQVERLEAFHGNRRAPLAELFSVSGSTSDGRIVFEGDLSGVHQIGRAMAGGEIRIEGDAGRHVGAEMSGGTVHVAGSAGDWLGAEMSGGRIVIEGSAGDHVGSAYPGGRRGMTEGTIVIAGAAGAEIGGRMRRGLIAVGGPCDTGAGFQMIAGTILVFGRCAARAGAGMKRGTLLLLGERSGPPLPTFRRAGTFRPLFPRLIFRELGPTALPVEEGRRLLDQGLMLYHGDLSALGKGEMWRRGEGPCPS